MGKVAIANAKVAYLKFLEICNSPRFAALKAKGAKVQRLLWASTGTKNPKYPDTYYVDELIGPDTVNTMPAATFNAFRDHGRPPASMLEGMDQGLATISTLAECQIDMKQVTEKLLVDGARLFSESFYPIISVITHK